jgi:hypothetical protein
MCFPVLPACCNFPADAWDERTLLIPTVRNAKYTIDLCIEASRLEWLFLFVRKSSDLIL